MAFDEVFLTQYQSVHRLETNKLRNVAKFFAHLLGTDGLPWTCLEYIKLNETDTTSSSRIFIKVLAQELSESLGVYCFILLNLIMSMHFLLRTVISTIIMGMNYQNS